MGTLIIGGHIERPKPQCELGSVQAGQGELTLFSLGGTRSSPAFERKPASRRTAASDPVVKPKSCSNLEIRENKNPSVPVDHQVEST